MNIRQWLCAYMVVGAACFPACASDSDDSPSPAAGGAAGSNKGGSGGTKHYGGSGGVGGVGGSGGVGGVAGSGGTAKGGSAGSSGASGQGGTIADSGLGGAAGADSSTGGSSPNDASSEVIEASAGNGGGGQAGAGGGSLGPEGPSCQPALTCASVSCCQTISIPATTFKMGRSDNGTDACPTSMSCGTTEQPEHDATLSAFYLDRFEVTVGRFRAFVAAYQGAPQQGAGAHPKIAASGWDSSWDPELPADAATLSAALACDLNSTWTAQPSSHEDHPIDCVTWFEAFAFCAWDGGRLPTEAEWELAAAGGQENRLYPWGAEAPSNPIVVWKGMGPIGVGGKPQGAGRWGHDDLAGNMNEWVLDWNAGSWYSGAGNPCNDCANLNTATSRERRGGSFMTSYESNLRAADRDYEAPSTRGLSTGFRCARSL